MTTLATPGPSDGRLHRLLGYLEVDPDNPSLLADAAASAVDAGAFAKASELLARLEALGPLTAAMRNLSGVIALGENRPADAVSIFEALISAGDAGPAIAFNLAWAKALLADYAGSLALLGDDVVAAAAAAPALKIQMLHHLGQIDEALACGEGLARQFPSDQKLMGALSLVAIDAEQLELARSYALRAGPNGDAMSTLGMLQLNDEHADEARACFEAALAYRPDNPRAMLGAGLERLVRGDLAAATGQLDSAAEMFGDHLGSWVASGWAYFVAGDLVTSRARFDRALALDDTFAESHGGLAVLDIAEGHFASGERRAEIALRLDRNCLGGALAKTMILTQGGHGAAADRIRSAVINRPLGPSGKSIAQAIVGFGLGSSPNKAGR